MYLSKSLPFFFLASNLPTLNCSVITWAVFGCFGGGFFWRFHVYVFYILSLFFSLFRLGLDFTTWYFLIWVVNRIYCSLARCPVEIWAGTSSNQFSGYTHSKYLEDRCTFGCTCRQGSPGFCGTLVLSPGPTFLGGT